MTKENITAIGTIVILIVIALIFFTLNTGCAPKCSPIRDISDYNAAIHTDYVEPPLYNSFEADVLGPIMENCQ